MKRYTLCLNCLNPGAHGVPVGAEKGTQRDPYRESVDLCEFCKIALVAGDFNTLAKRHAIERTINVDAQGGR